MAVDWGTGHYEHTAAELEPVSRTVVQRARVRPGERALDLGCGTGNAALELARAGAVVTAVDPAERLRRVAQERAASEGLTIEVKPGEAASIPAEDGSVDLLVSVFAVIFAPDPKAAMQEMRRVLAPGGRIVLTAWVPGTGFGKAYAILGASLSELTGAPPPPPPFPWYDAAVLGELAAAHDLSVSREELSISFTAESPEVQAALDAKTHPMSIATLAQLREMGIDEATATQQMADALRQVNEDSSAFRTTSRYVIATLRES